jgi:beta-glucanase (GH16 family)
VNWSDRRMRHCRPVLHPVPVATACLLVACGGSGGVSTGAPTGNDPATQINVNVGDPTLEIADNEPIPATGAMTLVWSDEFDAGKLDPGKWYFERGDGCPELCDWGNEELQWYLPDSAELRDGSLVITARKQSGNGKRYTSARISTRDRFAFRYGRIEARIRLARGQGLWSAFWLLPQDSAYGVWAASGEIDILEGVNLGGSGGNTIHGTIHFGGTWPENTKAGADYLVATDTTSDFHTYALEWSATEMRWYVDDVMYAVQDSWHSSGGDFPAPFDRAFYILFNVAVGGIWPGPPDATTAFPAVMEVDYVRVYSGDP